MVLAVRRGGSVRSVPRSFGVNKAAVERWKKHAEGRRLDRVDWNDQPDGPSKPVNRSTGEIEQCVLLLRKDLKENSPLGEHGADAILREMGRRKFIGNL